MAFRCNRWKLPVSIRRTYALRARGDSESDSRIQDAVLNRSPRPGAGEATFISKIFLPFELKEAAIELVRMGKEEYRGA